MKNFPLFLSLGITAWSLLNIQGHAAEKNKLRDHGSITLERAYDLALSSDQSISIAYVGLTRAKLAPLAAWTKLAPQISAVTSINGQSVRKSTTNTSSTAPHYNDAGITVQQPVFDATFFPARRAGQATLEGARLDYRATIRSILYGVATAYYDVLSQQKLLEVDQETLRLSTEQYDLAQKQAAVGVVTRSDVLRAQVVVEQARRSMVQDGNTLSSKRNVLANILNLPPDAEFELKSPPDYPTELPSFASVLGKAMVKREDLRSKDQAIQHDIEAHKQAKAAYVPKVIASVDAGRNNEFSSAYANNWQANLAVNIPIFNGGQRELDVKAASLQIEQTRLERAQLEKSIEQAVKDAWLNVKSLTETLAALRTQVSAAEQSYKDIQNQYTVGTSTSVDVLSALNDLNSARKDLALQTYSLQVALRNIEQVSGSFQEQRVNNAPHQ